MTPHRFDIHVCFTAAPALFSRAIRLVTGEPVSHVMVCYRSFDHGAWWVEEATEEHGAVVSVPAALRLRYLEETLREAYRLRFDQAQERRFLELFGASVGEPYDGRINWQLGAVVIGNRLAQAVGRQVRYVPRWPETRGRNCSEAVARVGRRFGLPCDATPTPGALARCFAAWQWASAEPTERLLTKLHVEAGRLAKIVDPPGAT